MSSVEREEVDPYDDRFVPLFDSIRRVPGLEHAHHRMYGVLASFRGKGERRTCAPKMAEIGERFGSQHDRYVRRLVHELEAAGVILVDRTPNAHNKPSRYTFLKHDAMAIASRGSQQPGAHEEPGAPAWSGARQAEACGEPEAPACVEPGPPAHHGAHVLLEHQNKNTQKRKSPRSRESDDRVFRYWVRAMGKTGRTILNGARLQKLRARRAEGYSDEQLIQAIDGCKLSTFHMGQNERGEVYNDLATILKDGATVERHIERAAQGPRAVRGTRGAAPVSAEHEPARPFELLGAAQ
jgi:hypothetical protein